MFIKGEALDLSYAGLNKEYIYNLYFFASGENWTPISISSESRFDH